jgi:hypothetical protein
MSNTKSVIRVSENFTIRKIEVKKINQLFFKGEYETRVLPCKKIKNTKGAIKMGKNVGQQVTEEVFQFKDRNNNYQTICTTNHALYAYADDETKEKPIIKCKYCKRSVLKNYIGLPIAIEKKDKNMIFYVTDSFCDFGCAYSFLKRKSSENRLFRNSLYMNAEQMLYCFYYGIYSEKVGEKIKEKPDWDLLRDNGGPLTNEEFDSDNTEYVPTPCIIMLPAKKQYIKLNTKNS